MNRTVVALVALSPLLASAQAQDTGTVDVYFQPVRVEGRLEGCSLVFTAMERDNAYLKNEKIVMNGSFVVRTMNRTNLFFTGKLGTRRIGDMAKWDEPHYFYFATTKGTTAGVAQIHASDTPGYKLLLAPALSQPVTTLLMEIIDEGRFTVGFNRKSGGQDVFTTIKINTSLKRDAAGNASIVENEETLPAFASCISDLMTSVKEQLERSPKGR